MSDLASKWGKVSEQASKGTGSYTPEHGSTYLMRDNGKVKMVMFSPTGSAEPDSIFYEGTGLFFNTKTGETQRSKRYLVPVVILSVADNLGKAVDSEEIEPYRNVVQLFEFRSSAWSSIVSMISQSFIDNEDFAGNPVIFNLADEMNDDDKVYPIIYTKEGSGLDTSYTATMATKSLKKSEIEHVKSVIGDALDNGFDFHKAVADWEKMQQRRVEVGMEKAGISTTSNTSDEDEPDF